MPTNDFQLTNRLFKDFASLDTAKGRHRTGLFVAEGAKCVGELMNRFECEYLFVRRGSALDACCKARHTIEAGGDDMRRLSRLSSPPDVIAFFNIPDEEVAETKVDSLVLALDRVQDPGNLGTILRCCDWMGVHTVVASTDTADIFNPKTVQASMGALARINVVYTDLVSFLGNLPAEMPIYGTFLDGANIYTHPLSEKGVIVMGNEGSGISAPVATMVRHRILIPSWPPESDTVESLNVGMATAITLSQFRARQFLKL